MTFFWWYRSLLMVWMCLNRRTPTKGGREVLTCSIAFEVTLKYNWPDIVFFTKVKTLSVNRVRTKVSISHCLRVQGGYPNPDGHTEEYQDHTFSTTEDDIIYQYNTKMPKFLFHWYVKQIIYMFSINYMSIPLFTVPILTSLHIPR